MAAVKSADDKRLQERTLIYKRHPDGTLTVGYDKGGETPAELTGIYTSIIAAEQAIARYKSLKA